MSFFKENKEVEMAFVSSIMQIQGSSHRTTFVGEEYGNIEKMEIPTNSNFRATTLFSFEKFDKKTHKVPTLEEFSFFSQI